MGRFNELNLETIKNANVPSTIIKREIKNMLECSNDCSAIVERVEKNTGRYRVILEGKLGKSNNLDSSYYLG